MNRIHLMPLGEVPPELLAYLRQQLPKELPAHYEILTIQPSPLYAFNTSRGQYSSTEILARLTACVAPDVWKVLGISCFDLYIPILTFVFGEAQLNGACAVVSAHRLRQEVYGFPADQQLLQQRLLKEAVHELGHTFGLMHCDEGNCVMSPSHSVEWIDLKSSHFCPSCRARTLEPEAQHTL